VRDAAYRFQLNSGSIPGHVVETFGDPGQSHDPFIGRRLIADRQIAGLH
jgi:hypothetical protein